MKVLMLNGSPHLQGNTYIALHEMEKIFQQEGVETEILQVGSKDIGKAIVVKSRSLKDVTNLMSFLPMTLFSTSSRQATPKKMACKS